MDFAHTISTLVRDGRFSFLKSIFEKLPKADIDRYINTILDGQTPLIIAIKHGYYEIAELLIENNADIEQTGTVNFDGESIEGASPLWLASASGNLDIVQLLIENNANVNSTTKTKSSPLRAACYDGHLNVVQYLVEHGADIELANRHGHTSLMIAAFKSNFEICKYLIENGADVNRRSFKGNTALHDCAETGSVEIMRLLIENKGRMMKDNYKITPLLTAALTGTESIVDLIINYGLDPFTQKFDESKSLCTEIERIHALELMGSTLVDKRRDISKGIQFWRIALERRQANIKRILDGEDVRNGETIETYQKKLAKPNAAYNHAVEFNSIEELDQIMAAVDDIRMQSLLIRERILGQTHSDTTYYIRFRGAVYADSGDFEMCIRLWLYALDCQQSVLDPLSPLTQSSLFSFAELFSYMMSNKADLVSFEEVFAVFKRALFELKSAMLFAPNKKAGHHKYQFYKLKLLQRISGGNELCGEYCLEDEIRGAVDNLELNDFISSSAGNLNEQLMKSTGVDVGCGDNSLSASAAKNSENLEMKGSLETINFHRILIILQLFIGLLCRLKPLMTDEQLYRLKKAVYQLVKLNPRGKSGFTALHQACYRDDSCQLIKFPICDLNTSAIVQLLVECGADTNARDNNGDTPLHIVAKNKPNNKTIIKTLIENNSHLDTRNNDGETPLDYLAELPKFLADNQIYPLRHLSLQCLCAQTINRNNLNYKNFLPKQVCNFIQIH